MIREAIRLHSLVSDLREMTREDPRCGDGLRETIINSYEANIPANIREIPCREYILQD